MTVTADLDVAAPRWHRDAGDPRHITYWNGARWTVHMRWDGAEWQRCEEPHEPPPVPAADLSHPGLDDAAPLGVTGVEAPAMAGAVLPAAAGLPTAADADAAAPAAAGPARRRRRRLYGMLAVLVLVAGAAGSAYVLRHRASSTGTVTPPVAPAAVQVLDRSLAAARTDGSVHLSTTESAGSISVSGTEDISLHQGQQTISGNAGSATVVAMPGAAYLKADAAFLQSSLGLSGAAAAKAAGTWVELRPSDRAYAQVASGVTLGSALVQAAPTGVLHLTAAKVLDGVRVVGITGGLPRDSVSGAVGHQVLYVEQAAPFLPVELDITGTLGGQSGTSTVSFSEWGEPVTATVPTTATPASALGS